MAVMSWYVLVLKIVESGVGCDIFVLFGIVGGVESGECPSRFQGFKYFRLEKMSNILNLSKRCNSFNSFPNGLASWPSRDFEKDQSSWLWSCRSLP